ncbi:coiled-coil domain-containing protein 93 isoform X2 [Camellia sinensis]|uniref:coiled-coil domain-containing protein 93 isoform X2 n=1 Tax=Camellia sinensis TaxID=4442 RepID=UPI001036EBEF|nr:coiled-coil domain-containing protein 93 isoform X2 [Camellia sinensis]
MVTCTENSIEEEEHAFVQLQEELKNVGSSIDTLNTNLEQLALEMQESEHKSNCNAKYSKLQAEVNELENIICGNDDANLSHGINHSLYNSLERLNSAKRELAVKLREIVLLKRQLDDVPSQEELIQYEHRFSELYVHIQEKLRQTRELYATFNAMLEIKDLMLKETSLLNSISSQFQDAITSTAGRTKLVDSMEGISKGTQQKLEKVRLTLEAERNVRDAVKQRYAAAIVEQRSCYSLLKAFQEECTKNERLRSLSSEILP